MARPAEVPDELRAAPFLASAVLSTGLLTERRLRSRVWVRLLRGVYVHRDVVIDQQVRLDALRLRLRPGDVVAGRTAAWVHGVWAPAPGAVVPWDVTGSRTSSVRDSDVGRQRLVLRGTPGRSGPSSENEVLDEDVMGLHGLSVLTPVRCCFDLMRQRGLVEAVAVADAFRFSGVVDPLALAMYATDRRRWPHVRMVRVALTLSVSGSRSIGESRLRMVVVLSGLPEPAVNAPLLDAQGRVLAIPDLTVTGRLGSVGLEYDGRYHDSGEQPAADRRRENTLLTAAGLPLLRYDREALYLRRDQVLAEVCGATGGRPRSALLARDFRRPAPQLAW